MRAQPPHFEAVQGASEERSQAYTSYVENAPQLKQRSNAQRTPTDLWLRQKAGLCGVEAV